MHEKRTRGIGVGGTAVSLVLASCPLQLAVFEALGMTGVLGSAWFETSEPFVLPALLSFAALTIYGAVRLFRRRRAPGIAPTTLEAP